MCLVTEKQPELLEDDLIVYKVVQPLLDRAFQSSFKYYKYLLHDLQPSIVLLGLPFEEVMKTMYGIYANEAAFKFYIDRIDVEVYLNGYHFYIDATKAQKHNIFPAEVIVECMVPAGSTVVYDSTGMGVASQIKLVRVIS